MAAVQKLCIRRRSTAPPCLRQSEHHKQHIDQLDEDKGSDQTAEAVDQQIAGKQLAGGHLPVLDTLGGPAESAPR